MNGDLENLSVDQSYFSEQEASIIRYQRKIRRGSISSARKSSGIVMEHALYAERSMKGDVLVADVKELQENDTSEVCQKDSKQGSSRGFHVPMCKWFRKIDRERFWSPSI